MYCLNTEEEAINFIWVTVRIGPWRKPKEEKTFEQDLERWVRSFLEDTQQVVKRRIDSTMSWTTPCDGIKMPTILLILIPYVLKLLDGFNAFISISFGISLLFLNSTLAECDGVLYFLWIWHIDSRGGWPQMNHLENHIFQWSLQRLMAPCTT